MIKINYLKEEEMVKNIQGTLLQIFPNDILNRVHTHTPRTQMFVILPTFLILLK